MSHVPPLLIRSLTFVVSGDPTCTEGWAIAGKHLYRDGEIVARVTSYQLDDHGTCRVEYIAPPGSVLASPPRFDRAVP